MLLMLVNSVKGQASNDGLGWGGGVVSAEERGRMYVNGFRRQMPRGRWHLEQDSESMLTPLPVNDLLTHTRKKSEDSQGQSGRV